MLFEMFQVKWRKEVGEGIDKMKTQHRQQGTTAQEHSSDEPRTITPRRTAMIPNLLYTGIRI